MAMDIINPFDEIVVFGKAFPLEPTSSTVIAALRPTGRHLGTGGTLTHVRGHASGGPATSLEHYTTSPKGLGEGPFHGSQSQPKTKLFRVEGHGTGYRTGPFRKGIMTAAPAKGLVRGGVARSLDSIANIPKPTLKPTGQSWKQPITAAVNRGGGDYAHKVPGGNAKSWDYSKADDQGTPPYRMRNSNIPNAAQKGGRL